MTDTVNDPDPELTELQAEWLLARGRQLGHISAFSFDVQATPPECRAATSSTSEVCWWEKCFAVGS